MTIIVRRNRANILRIGPHPIFPGLNEIKDEAVLKELASDPVWKDLLDSGVHEIIQKPVEDQKDGGTKLTADITLMSQKDALAIVEGCHIVPQLSDMIEAEGKAKNRPKVIKALQDKIEDMTKLPEKKEG